MGSLPVHLPCRTLCRLCSATAVACVVLCPYPHVHFCMCALSEVFFGSICPRSIFYRFISIFAVNCSRSACDEGRCGLLAREERSAVCAKTMANGRGKRRKIARLAKEAVWFRGAKVTKRPKSTQEFCPSSGCTQLTA